MARVQVVMSDADHTWFRAQARKEGMSLSAWMRAAAQERLESRRQTKRFESVEDLRAFFRECDELAGEERGLDWEEYLVILNESKMRGLPDV